MKTYTSPTIKLFHITPTTLLAGSGPEVTVTSDEMGGTEEQYFGSKSGHSGFNNWDSSDNNE